MGGQPMSDEEFDRFMASQPDLRQMAPDELRRFLDELRPMPTTPEQEARLLAALPPADPDAPMVVVRSLRLPLELNQRLEDAAKTDGVSASAFIRRAVESALAGHDRTNLVNIEDVIRAVRSVPPAAA